MVTLAVLPHIPQAEIPGQALAVELSRQGAIRGWGSARSCLPIPIRKRVEIVHPKLELLRLAIPRRTYTQRSHGLRGRRR